MIFTFKRAALAAFYGAIVSAPVFAVANELPAAIKAVEAKGVRIVDQFEAPAGLTGYAGEINGQGVAMYLTKDGKNVIVGTLLDEQANDLTAEPMEKLVYGPLGDVMWERMENSTWIADGKDDAERIVYVFSDPNCPYCTQFWEQARPWVESGKVQVRHIMVGMLRPDSAGKAAAMLTAADPSAALTSHEQGKRNTQALKQIPGEVRKQLAENLDLMNELGSSATPSIFYKENGRLENQQGAPQPEALERIMGSAKPQ